MASDMNRDPQQAPELSGMDLPEKPDGPAAAAMVAAGIGILVLGIFTVLAEASTPIHDFLEGFDFDRGVGPLAGKAVLAVVAWAVSWVVLGVAWKKKDVNLRRMFWVGLILGLVGALCTFPPFFTAFAAE